jgi:hypothetical protein
MKHEEIVPGMRVSIKGQDEYLKRPERFTVRTVRPTSIILQDAGGAMLAADAGDLIEVEPNIYANLRRTRR